MTPEWTVEYAYRSSGGCDVVLYYQGQEIAWERGGSVQEAVEMIIDNLRRDILDAIEPQLAEQAHYEAEGETERLNKM